MLKKLIKKQPRCIHRHTEKTHPSCFVNGKPILKEGFPKNKLPKILILDIETAPLRAFVFQKSVWNANVTDEQVISEWFMLCWSAKWLFDTDVFSARLTGKEALAEDDSRIVGELWKLLDEADIVVAHNASGFDVPNMNTRFLLNGLPPTSPYQVIDTKVVAKRQFGFTHNTLSSLARLFGIGGKLDTDFDLWKRATSGDDKAIEYMEKYNKEDVLLLEDVYMKLRPWIRSHPNLGLYVESDEPVCPNCGSSNIKWTGKYYYTQTGRYDTFKCECGAIGRNRKSQFPKEKRDALAISIAK